MKKYKDHKGNYFPSKTEMCKAYNITLPAYNSRIRRGWSQEKALSTPLGETAKGYENFLLTTALYRKNHADEIRENSRIYREKNKEKIRTAQAVYHKKRKEELNEFREWKNSKEEFNEFKEWKNSKEEFNEFREWKNSKEEFNEFKEWKNSIEKIEAREMKVHERDGYVILEIL